MAYLREVVIQKWIGPSTDVKPTSAPVGSKYLEYDTGDEYICYDAVNWAFYRNVNATANNLVSGSFPYVTEFWETEVLSAAIWGTTIDGAGTEVFATASGYMYYDMNSAAVADSDILLYSNNRWQVRPANFGDTNSMIRKFILEFELEVEAAISTHDNTDFLLGLSSAQSGDITQQNLIGFFLDSDALKGKTDNAGTESVTDEITATLTDWNKFKITVEDTSVTFSLNGQNETPIAANLPSDAMYLVFGTRAEGGASVGLNIGNIRSYYEE